MKALRWKDRGHGNGDIFCNTVVGQYAIGDILGDVMVLLRRVEKGQDHDETVWTGDDFKDARAAAQADYERRVLSALSPAAPEGREDRCATEGCENRATNEFIRGDVGSHYCGDCFVKVVEACDTPRPTRAVTEAMVDAAQDVLLKHVEDRALILQALTAALAQEGK